MKALGWPFRVGAALVAARMAGGRWTGPLTHVRVDTAKGASLQSRRLRTARVARHV